MTATGKIAETQSKSWIVSLPIHFGVPEVHGDKAVAEKYAGQLEVPDFKIDEITNAARQPFVGKSAPGGIQFAFFPIDNIEILPEELSDLKALEKRFSFPDIAEGLYFDSKVPRVAWVWRLWNGRNGSACVLKEVTIIFQIGAKREKSVLCSSIREGHVVNGP